VNYANVYLVGAVSRCRKLFWVLFGLVTPFLIYAQQDEKFAVLAAGSETYSNVTVTTKKSKYIMITHAGGMATIKLKDLSKDTLRDLGYVVDPPPKAKSKPELLAEQVAADPRIKQLQETARTEIVERWQRLDPRVIQAVLAGVGLLYLFFCYCNMLICKKAGQQPGVLVWIPVLQTFPMLKAAGMSAWWFVLLIVPVTGIIVGILWCVKICKARAKPSWLAVCLLLPVTNLFAYLYLAFADGPKKDPSQERITFD